MRVREPRAPTTEGNRQRKLVVGSFRREVLSKISEGAREKDKHHGSLLRSEEEKEEKKYKKSRLPNHLFTRVPVHAQIGVIVSQTVQTLFNVCLGQALR